MKKFFICFDPVMGMVEVSRGSYEKKKVDHGYYVKAGDADLALALIKDISNANVEDMRPSDLISLWQRAAKSVIDELSA